MTNDPMTKLATQLRAAKVDELRAFQMVRDEIDKQHAARPLAERDIMFDSFVKAWGKEQSAERADVIRDDIYLATTPAERWPKLCGFLDRIAAKVPAEQRAAFMNRLARAIGDSFVEFDPSMQPHADALTARYPEPIEAQEGL